MEIFIPDIMQEIVGKVNATLSTRTQDPFPVYFDFGHYVEVVRNLTLKDCGITSKDAKYPLVWMVMDFDEKRWPKRHIYAAVSLHLIIAVPTQNTYTMRQRAETVFKPRLYPIYEELMKQIAAAPAFLDTPTKVSELPHIKTDRPYWGGQDAMGNGERNMFNDFIDAIQIKDLKLNIKAQKECSVPSL